MCVCVYACMHLCLSVCVAREWGQGASSQKFLLQKISESWHFELSRCRHLCITDEVDKMNLIENPSERGTKKKWTQKTQSSSLFLLLSTLFLSHGCSPIEKKSVETVAYCEWHAAAPGLKPLCLPRARSPRTGEGGDWWSWPRGVKEKGIPWVCHGEWKNPRILGIPTIIFQ